MNSKKSLLRPLEKCSFQFSRLIFSIFILQTANKALAVESFTNNLNFMVGRSEEMIDGSMSFYYITYGLACALMGVLYLKMKSTEAIVITTKEFKLFQNSFLTGYAAIILAEILSAASFYHNFLALELTFLQIAKLYTVTIVSTTMFGLIFEIIDIGSKKDKCMFSALFYFVATLSLFIGEHFEMLLLGRILFGAASALHHTSFEAYIIHEHSSNGFPEDWLSQTFAMLTHAMSLVAAASGMLGQMAAFIGSLNVAALSCIIFIGVAVYVMLEWKKDISAPRFMMSSFTFNMNQTLHAARSNKYLVLVLVISALCESAITVFTFYWAPLLTALGDGTEAPDSESGIPYELVFSTLIMSSMTGNYLYQMLAPSLGSERLLQAILLVSAISFVAIAFVRSAVIMYPAAVLIQVAIGCYWPAIGALRGRFVAPELRATALALSRVVSLGIIIPALSCSFASSSLVISACACCHAIAAYLHARILTDSGALSGVKAADKEDPEGDDN